ncbi:globin domain-containing protein [Calidifontibacter indicus]|uniref:nitric oxide dioxygenase n=1 Tax=Calidifontibacter indicus TaxID=419650 RepID=A0A3D9UTS7_9MICO|nr:globin domain-containing protein [Calidifontibacter indicus]REF31370.1 nitric oxide dioxygenase [Calidifontibacter indicus]
MLQPDNAEIVKATAPVVIEHITEITKVFYPKMFANNPELLNVFNQANQAIGEQPVALASSIVAYAHHLLGDADFDFDAVIDRIANKHVALAIAPADYTVVGRNLLEAIGDVLGDAVTPEVACAWGEVYWLFAVDLISAEARIYQQIERTPDTMLTDHEIVAIEDAGTDARTFRLAPVDGSEPPAHIPGHYVSVVVQLRDDYRQPRQYTISSAPGTSTIDITVRRVTGADGAPDGAVSTYLFDRSVGDVVKVSVPVGDIRVSHGDRPLVMFSAGIGVTPMAAILSAARAQNSDRRLLHVHADADVAHHPLREQVAADIAALPNASGSVVYELNEDGTQGGLVDVAALDLPQDALYYLCGSVPFMQYVRSELIGRGVDAGDISYEIFGPDLWLGGSASSQASEEELARV